MKAADEFTEQAKKSYALGTPEGRADASTYRIMARAVGVMASVDGKTINDIEVALGTAEGDLMRYIWATEAGRMLKGSDRELVRTEYPRIVALLETVGLA